ncbi:hypothetical protein THRCLA_20307 [Thraustotheca clavata]|uniref:Uncharacterized protein n=1 Tax=Thraustotheca clavata TaxID=74557 RepID=A0A1W0A952_9STRA|nr:hypothetical protein THRCLA_20307 [Thraustotheca clavata]
MPNGVMTGIKRLMHKKDIEIAQAEYASSVRQVRLQHSQAIAASREDIADQLQMAANTIDLIIQKLRTEGDEVSSHPDYIAAHDELNSIRQSGSQRIMELDKQLQTNLDQLKMTYTDKMNSLM